MSEFFLFDDVVEDGLEGEGGVGVWAKCILGRRYDIVFGQVEHDLVVEQGVKEFGDDGEE